MRVLVTGSTQGIGKAVAAALAERGYEVIVHCSRDAEKARRVKEEIGVFSSVVCDLSRLDEVKGLHGATGDVDCLILNASIQNKEKWTEVSIESLEKQIAVNLESTLLLMQAYYPAMADRGFGRIITVGSVNQHRRHPELSVYSATKCAVMSLVKNIAKEAAPYGVTVNNVAPGAIATPRNAEVYNEPEKRRAVEEIIPLGRFGRVEDCVGAILLLCSEEGSYITGADIIIDGGMSL